MKLLKMKIRLLRQLIVILSLTCAMRAQIKLIKPSKEDYREIKAPLKAAFKEFSDINRLYNKNEFLKYKIHPYDYYISEDSTSNNKEEDEQWKYFYNNHLKRSFQDLNVFNESAWVVKYGPSVLTRYLEVVYKNQSNPALFSLIFENEELLSELFKRLYKLNHSNCYSKYVRKFGYLYKRVGILLKIEGAYKSVDISFEGVEPVKMIPGIFSHAEFVNKYTMGSEQELIMTYCKLFLQRNKHYDQLCSKITDGREIQNIVIERTYYTLNLEPDKWIQIYPNKNIDDIDFSKMLIDNTPQFTLNTGRKRKAEQTSAKNTELNSETLKLLEKLSNSRYVGTNQIMTKDVLMKLFDDPYLKYEETIVFSRAERETCNIQMSEKTQFLSKQFIIPQTFKVIILKNSSIDMVFLALVKYMGQSISLMSEVILKLEDLQAGYKKDGMDSFLFGNLQAYNLEKWNFIKTNFISKMIISDTKTYLGALEYFIIRDIATFYSSLEGIDVNRWQQGLNSKKHEFFNPIIWKLYVYTYELKAGEEKHISQDANDTASWTQALIDLKWTPEWINEIANNQSVKDSLIFEKVIPELIVPETVLIKCQPSLKSKNYQYNRSFLNQVLKFSMNIVMRPEMFKRDDMSLVKWKDENRIFLKKHIADVYKSKVSQGNLLTIENYFNTDIFEVKNIQPSWFKHYISSENFLTLRPTIPALFFREFHIVEKDVEAKT